jgi:PAS domain S-box-containing protein
MSSLASYVTKGGFFRAVVEDGSDLIFIVDYNGKILYHNNSVKGTLGYKAKSLINKNFFDYVLPGTRVALVQKFNSIKRKHFQEGIEFQFLCKNGSYKHLEFNSINLKIREKINGFILDCRDITQRKKDAEELQRAQRAKEQFLANISHEIRTPINGIAGMATLLTQNPSDLEGSLYLSAIQSASENLKVIINDILDLASIESGKLKFEKIAFNLSDMFNSLKSTFDHQAREKRITLEFDLDPNVNQLIIGDPVRLNQILINLISNALKFTPRGGIRIKCNVGKLDKRIVHLRFEVNDTGIGIPEDKLITIFESFSQADTSVTRKYGGTGLGLTIVKQLVELQGGQVSVKSVVDEGSSFSFTLPYEISALKSSNLHSYTLKGKTERTLRGMRVLLVEDNEINRLYATTILKNWGCITVLAENGFVAVEKVTSEFFNAVLMDVQMPVMDGFEATKSIRSLVDADKKNIPIIALTANATRKDYEKCLAEGMDDCITKPFTPDDLFKVLNRYRPVAVTVPSPPISVEKKDHKIKKSKIDFSYLKTVSNNDQEFIDEIVNTFIGTIPEHLRQIKTFLENNNWKEVAHVVHKIKSSLSLLGLQDIKNQAIEIENSAKLETVAPGFVDKVNAFIEALTFEMNHLKELHHKVTAG